jgi:catechol 2,3-dioxygenase-like lactoylglutathione lyase family enzyme
LRENAVTSSNRSAGRRPGVLSSVVLYVDDVERSAAFYSSVFGLVQVFRVERDYGISVMLRPEDEPLAPGVLLSEGRLGVSDQPALDSFGRLIFRVEDAEETWNLAMSEGWTAEKEIEIRPEGFIFGLLRDPDGVIIEVMQVCSGPGEATSGE